MVNVKISSTLYYNLGHRFILQNHAGFLLQNHRFMPLLQNQNLFCSKLEIYILLQIKS